MDSTELHPDFLTRTLLFLLSTAVSLLYYRQETQLSTATISSKEKNKTTLPPAPILKAADHANDSKRHLLLACSGSVATIKLPNMIQALSTHKNLSIRIILTSSAAEFLQGQSSEQPSLQAILQMPNVEGIYFDSDEWKQPWTRGASILHIELRRWADLMLIAPLSANGLASLSLGLSGNLLYSVARAWDTTGLIDKPRNGIGKKVIMVAPAMNTAMWNHPVTKRHLDILEGEWNVKNGGWVEVLRPIEKDLACGDMGGGAMREWSEIVEVVQERLG
ncbi:Coenzyme A biosynthesis protein 3 [Fulvia fulva]|uniref:Coenzyme A biosynthesis protein 3 n=1 Tax=Passalora fulva TaxID=5499 RepID=A0A9Q8PKK7_PASFU|nr:Coenzyme A biosynthesis protein 3 [Fulvia fulva]KAK4610417.1 Coenzyme A biosynthesis protein 3 [Fulvia fulva]KAK4610826.1 Coenzyme A biosynthesis protein 3 [Fulvia fulva]UJO24151.1 Coenzyme A biosynthesis protein 3 [Fulvia fulva]WPV22262.1 Coenzyme A biosynthesis protein 3 [Fulvia fulva]WPV36673.1 Coenzyme A biosynthesis protein 3 [Fulvia fulva]